MAVILCLIILAMCWVAYVIGKVGEYNKGFNHGYVKGNNDGVKRWHAAMEQRRGPDGKDELVRIIDRHQKTGRADG